jgi:YegS/Rv2252/BmrU family lipid kinase
VKIAFIVNPAAGGRRQPWNVDVLHAAFDPRGVEVSIHVTTGPGDARRLANALAAEADLICAVGGDGTVHEVVNGILPRRVPLAVIPRGSGNDLASLVDCPATPEDLARLVEEGWGAQVDVIDIGDRFCVNSAGLGFEGSVNRASHGLARLGLGGRTRYVVALAKALGALRCPDFRIVTSRGDEITGKKLLVSIGNGHRTGGAFYLTPDAFPDDGLIDLCIIEPMSRVKMLRILPRALDGSHTRRPEVLMLRVESLTVEATKPYPMHVDGEYVPAGPERREIAVRPAALTFLCRRSGRNKLVRDPVRMNW